MKSTRPRRLHPSATLRSSTIIFHPSSQPRQRHRPPSSTPACATGGGGGTSTPRSVPPRRSMTARHSPPPRDVLRPFFSPPPLTRSILPFATFNPPPRPSSQPCTDTVPPSCLAALLPFFTQSALLLLLLFLSFPSFFAPIFRPSLVSLSLSLSRSSRNLSARDPRVTHPLPPARHPKEGEGGRNYGGTDRAHASLPYL